MKWGTDSGGCSLKRSYGEASPEYNWRGLMLAPSLSLNVFHTGCHSSLLS